MSSDFYTPLMPGESAGNRLNGLIGNVGRMDGRVSSMEDVLQRHRPTTVVAFDSSGQKRAFSVLATPIGNGLDSEGWLRVRKVRDSWEVGVTEGFRVFSSIIPASSMNIEGRLNADETTGWLGISLDNPLFLEIEFDNWPFVKATRIKTGELLLNAPPWTDGSIVERTGPAPSRQKNARKVLAYFDGEKVVQVTFRDQVLRNICLNGIAALYPFDHEGGVP